MRVLPCIRGVFAAGCLGPFAGLYVPSGRLIPYFSRRMAHRIAGAYRALPCLDGEPARQAFYDRAADAFRFLDCVSGEWLVWCGTRFRESTLYPIGSPDWTWELVGIRV